MLLAAALMAAPVVADAGRYDGDISKLAISMSEEHVKQHLGPPARVEMMGPSMKRWRYQDGASPDQLDVYFFRLNDGYPWLVDSWRSRRVH
jgi:hypothetical protein